MGSLFLNDKAVGNGIQWKLFSTLISSITLNNNFCSRHLFLLWWWFPFGSKLLNWFTVQGPISYMNDACTEGPSRRGSSSPTRTVRIWHSFLTRKEEMLKPWKKKNYAQQIQRKWAFQTGWVDSLFSKCLFWFWPFKNVSKCFFFSNNLPNLSKGNAISNVRKRILGMPERPNIATIPKLFSSHWETAWVWELCVVAAPRQGVGWLEAGSGRGLPMAWLRWPGCCCLFLPRPVLKGPTPATRVVSHAMQKVYASEVST